MGRDGVDDLVALPVPARQFSAHGRMRPLDTRGEGLADVVQECRSSTHLGIRPDLGGKLGSQTPTLDAVGQHVLAVGGPKPQRPDDGAQRIGELGDVQLAEGIVGCRQTHVLDLLHGSSMCLLDTSGMDPAIGDETLQRGLGNFTTHGVETAHQDDAGGVVNNDRGTSRLLDGTDVATLTADDPALHGIGRQVDDGHHGISSHLTGMSFDGRGNDVSGPGLGSHPGLGHDGSGQLFGLQGGLLPRPSHDLLASLLRSESTDVHKFVVGLLQRGLRLLDLLVEQRHSIRMCSVEGVSVPLDIGLEVATALSHLAFQPGAIPFQFVTTGFDDRSGLAPREKSTDDGGGQRNGQNDRDDRPGIP